jgi:hypothetical protein
MADYLLLYSGGSMPQSEEEQAAVMKAWNSWFETLGSALKDGGNPFTPGAASTVSADGSVSEGGIAPGASGYSIIQADDLNAAVDLAKGCPVTMGGASISVYETFAAFSVM